MLVNDEHDIYLKVNSTSTRITLRLTLRGKVEVVLKERGNQLHTLCTTDKNTNHANITVHDKDSLVSCTGKATSNKTFNETAEDAVLFAEIHSANINIEIINRSK